MNIAFLGAGHMAEALAPAWLAAGHEVTIGGRTPSKAEDLAARVGARPAGSLAAAAAAADVVVLAVLYAGIEETVRAAGPLDGKVLIDVNNPVEVERFTLVDFDGAPSLAAWLARATGAEVVKAMNLVQADVWRRRVTFAGAPLVVPVATDSARARGVADGLVRAAGGVPLDAGGLEHAGYVEAMGAVIVRHLWGGADPLSAFQLVVGQAATAD
ncbi:Pyrroline-5-carboxylate reductase [Baekduia alba]|uniref:NADPH-dependent F420 reductase n=1 Tax=Baekduia alba TaxID=2997333 RepID=UPI002340FD37|nr:NAD(P)-binding domain-containing protein [Baekduia alba]WCB92232.1 Pyrroline-5-carboxylate reductase [Baekduia alba]